MTPDNQGFWDILHSAPPPGERTTPFLVVDAETKLLRPATIEDLTDYTQGGELEEMNQYWENGTN
ncbi:MAG: hypothetical protein HC799_16170 [Limnothrix sp. RL_2_0]|nr:hypothetical protein [Limnothrix sp. RL_2_0]